MAPPALPWWLMAAWEGYALPAPAAPAAPAPAAPAQGADARRYFTGDAPGAGAGTDAVRPLPRCLTSVRPRSRSARPGRGSKGCCSQQLAQRPCLCGGAVNRSACLKGVRRHAWAGQPAAGA
jgi:hypothetical protein